MMRFAPWTPVRASLARRAHPDGGHLLPGEARQDGSTAGGPRRRFLAATVWILSAGAASGIIVDLTLVGQLHEPRAEHVDQLHLLELVQAGDTELAFEEAFEMGDELFETVFNALDGAGANVGEGMRFTRVPRADLTGPGEWANHIPPRITGPNAEACNHCHNTPFDDGAGNAASDVHRDPLHTASLASFIRRDTPHLFAPGAIQRLAEEMTEDLHAIRDGAAADACALGIPVTRELVAKGVDFGSITAMPAGDPCVAELDATGVEGVAADLVIRPFQWKGANASVRDFNRGASHNELGMQAVEITGAGVDGDFDGVADEMTIGDQTALAVYIAAQPRPTTRLELASLGLIDPLSEEEKAAIERGKVAFRQAQCQTCHVPALRIDDPVFSEPSQNPNFRDAVFPAGQDPIGEGVDPAFPISFDLTEDQPDNIIRDEDGNVIRRLGSLEVDAQGRGVVRLLGDLRRHDMGEGLAERIDDIGTGAASFLTESLWGVGSTAPYLHDGRATTLTEAILEHGGEAEASREAFVDLSEGEQADLIAFLGNQVLFKVEEEEE